MKREAVYGLLCASLSAGCQPSSHVPPNSGIDFRLSSSADNEAPRPDGVFRVEELDVRRAVHVPLTPLEVGSTTQRIELPAGNYRVSYLPVELEPSLKSLRRRETVKSLSLDAFVVVVSKGTFSVVNVLAVDAAGTRPLRERPTLQKPEHPPRALDAAIIRRLPVGR